MLTVGSWKIAAVKQMPCFPNSNLIDIIVKAAWLRFNCKMAQVNVCAIPEMTQCRTIASILRAFILFSSFFYFVWNVITVSHIMLLGIAMKMSLYCKIQNMMHFFFSCELYFDEWIANLVPSDLLHWLETFMYRLLFFMSLEKQQQLYLPKTREWRRWATVQLFLKNVIHGKIVYSIHVNLFFI